MGGLLPGDRLFLGELFAKASANLDREIADIMAKAGGKDLIPSGDEVAETDSHGLTIPEGSHITEGPGGIADSLFHPEHDTEDE